jgi:hypothetical protein
LLVNRSSIRMKRLAISSFDVLPNLGSSTHPYRQKDAEYRSPLGRQRATSLQKNIQSSAETTGAVVPGAKVTLIAQATNIETERPTNDSGYFTFVNVKPGNYKARPSRMEVSGWRRRKYSAGHERVL